MDAPYRLYYRWLHIYPNGDVKVYTKKRTNPDPGCVVQPLRIKVPCVDERPVMEILMPSPVEIT